MTDIEQALTHYDGDNSKPYCDLVYEALRLLRDEREGRVVRLPCKVGDTVYKWNKASGKINPWIVNDIYFNSKTEMVIEAGKGIVRYSLKDFGKTVFLSRAQAEAAMEESANSAM